MKKGHLLEFIKRSIKKKAAKFYPNENAVVSVVSWSEWWRIINKSLFPQGNKYKTH